jgi:putative MATE family efflux protein
VSIGAAPSPLLDGPILRTLLKLAAPNVVAMSLGVCVGIAETFYVGLLGVAPLAAMALVFPFAMLTGMLSAGAMGGGVSSAISRALGAGDTQRAQAVAKHALLIGLIAGAIYSVVLLAARRWLFSTLGGSGAVLDEAVAFSTVLFGGALSVWVFNTLASIVRGTGNMRVPSIAIGAVMALQIAIGGGLGLGLGPLPRLGMPGVASGQILAMALGTLFLLWYLRRDDARVRLRWRSIPVSRALFWEILKVGAVACLSPLQSVLTMLLMAGFVAHVGVVQLAGYAIGQRLEFLMTTVAFGVGVASVPMVGMAIGAGQVARARRVAWTAGAVTLVSVGVIGIVVALAPDLWGRIFTREDSVLTYTRQFLHWTGPLFGVFGFGLTVYFSSQGAGRMAGPVAAATLRLALVAGLGSWLTARDAPAWQLFAMVMVAMAVYGGTCALALRYSRWERVA